MCAHDFTIIDRFEDFQRKLILFAGIVSSSFAARDIGGGHRFKAEIWRSLGQERLGSMWLRVFFFFFFLMRIYSPYFYFSNNIFRKKKKKDCIVSFDLNYNSKYSPRCKNNKIGGNVFARNR